MPDDVNNIDKLSATALINSNLNFAHKIRAKKRGKFKGFVKKKFGFAV